MVERYVDSKTRGLRQNIADDDFDAKSPERI